MLAPAWDERREGAELGKHLGYHRANLRVELRHMGLFVKPFLNFLL